MPPVMVGKIRFVHELPFFFASKIPIDRSNTKAQSLRVFLCHELYVINHLWIGLLQRPKEKKSGNSAV
jgi:hypothetical protein